MPSHVIFDIDDTLFPSTDFSSRARENSINAMVMMGLDAEPASLLKDLEAIIREKGSNYERHFDDLCLMNGIKDPSRYVAAAIAAYHDTKTAIQPYPTVPLTLLRLRESGFRLHVATDGVATKQWDKLIRLKIALYFDNVFVSGEMGRSKSPLFFKKVLKTLHASPDRCVMVGDREDKDIVPAKSVGMKTVRVLCGKYSEVGDNGSAADCLIEDIGLLPSVLRRMRLI